MFWMSHFTIWIQVCWPHLDSWRTFRTTTWLFLHVNLRLLQNTQKSSNPTWKKTLLLKWKIRHHMYQRLPLPLRQMLSYQIKAVMSRRRDLITRSLIELKTVFTAKRVENFIFDRFEFCNMKLKTCFNTFPWRQTDSRNHWSESIIDNWNSPCPTDGSTTEQFRTAERQIGQ